MPDCGLTSPQKPQCEQRYFNRSLNYITADNAIQLAQNMGRGTLPTKIDIGNAFRLLPVHPTDRHLLVMRWKQQLYIWYLSPLLGFALPLSF